ncbi:MAG: tetratricopeptide repeat protein [Thermodesulfovibrionales bacterium]|nr:tetratricopeptide repeat protein [Thermodesulfovibrionales bacterium]
MRHIFAIMIAALFLFYPSHGFTQVKDGILSQSKEIVSEGAYNMGDGETPSVAESRALLNAKQIALDQAGTYVESYTKVENLELTKDEIQVLTSGIIEAKITDDERLLQANEWFDKGYKYGINKEYDAAIEAFTSSIALNPNDAKAYLFRGAFYGSEGQYDRAIEDLNKAIALNPNIAEAYYKRGRAYAKLGNMGRAISDFQKACDMGSEKGCSYLQKALQNR